MAASTRDQDRRHLEHGLLTDEYQGLLERLQAEEQSLRGFGRWPDVVAFMRTGPASDPRTDVVLRPVLGAYGRDRDPRWLAILVVLVWHELETIARWKGHWDRDDGELWANIVATFFRVVSRLDVTRRPARLGQKLRNDVIHHVYAGYARRWARERPELAMVPRELENLADARTPDFDEILDARAACDREMERLRAHRAAGRLTEPEFLLMLGTRIYGASLAGYARGAGLKVETVKKRRQRLEARLRRFEGAAR
jgi:DNA-directed RNA polymerase specialized sigma24 family protein